MSITTKNGLLYDNGREMPVGEADREAAARGFNCAEQLVKSLELSQLATALYDAKKAEDAAKKIRIAVEDQIALMVETAENGSRTVNAGDLKVTVKRALSYEADVNAIMKVEGSEDDMPLTLVPAEWVFDEKRYEALRQENPALFAALSAHVTTKPRKVSVTLKLA